MAITAPVPPGLTLALLARIAAALPLPEAGKASTQPESRPLQPQPQQDAVVFSSAPMRILSDLASAGLQQLARLLPAIEQAAQDQNAAPLGQLAKAAAAAARQIGDGHAALLAEGPDRVAAALARQPPASIPALTGDAKELLRTVARQLGAAPAPEQHAPEQHVDDTLRTIARQIGAQQVGPLDHPGLRPAADPAAHPNAGPIERWLAEAKHTLHATSDVLDRAEERIRPLVMPDLAAPLPATLTLAEIVAAQTQVAVSYASLRQIPVALRRTEARASARLLSLPLDRLAGATTLLGTLLVAATLWLIGGIWTLAAGCAAIAATAFWVWRISLASRGVTLDARR